jgi:hypothetical protein
MFNPDMFSTLRQAIRGLSSTPMLLYRQRLDIRNLYADQDYAPYLHHRPEHEILILTFPRECESILWLSNNYGCKMVQYRTVNGFLKESEITSDSMIDVDSNTAITIYTRSKPDLIITFDMVLTAIRSRL